LSKNLSSAVWPAIFNSSAALKTRDPISLCNDLLLAWAMVKSRASNFAPHPRLGATFEAAKKQLGIPSTSPTYLAYHLKMLQEKAA